LTPKSVRLDFPRFDGEDPETWCCCAEEFIELYRTPAEHCISISYYHMDGHAVRWYRELLASKKVTDWEELVRAIHTKIRFMTT